MAIFSNIQHLINGVDIDTLLSQIEELTNKLKKEKAESCKSISTLSSKLEQAQKKNDNLKEDLTRETNRCHIAESKLAESESRIVSLAKENNELLKTEEKLKADLQKLGASNSGLNGKNLTLHNKVAKLENQIQQLKDEINVKGSEISSINKNAERLENRLKNETSLLDEAKNLVETLNKDNQQLKAEISIKTEENTIISSQVENLKKINQELNADCEDKLQRINVLEKDIKDIQDTFESVTCDNNCLQQTCKTISNDNQELKRKNNELSDRFTTLNSDFESLKTENDRVCSELELQKTALEQTNAENTQLKNDLQTVQNEFSSAQEQLDVYGKNLDSLQSQIQILNSEKEELKPYMYLIEAKKEEEAKEHALNLAKDTLQELVDKANSVLTDLKHDEVSTLLSSAISTAQEQMSSAKDIAAIDDAKHELDKSINQAQSKESDLLEEEKRKQQKKEASENAAKLLSETRNALTRLIDEAKKYKETIEYADIATELQYVIESVVKFSEVNSDNIQEIQSNILSLQTALSNAKNDVTSEKKTQSHVVKRSILEIFDTKEGDIIESEKFFKRPEHELVRWRRIFEESILYAEHRFICTNCRQDVKISGRKYERGQVAFFSHLHDSDFC
jgi:chromosome segregation ATPase